MARMSTSHSIAALLCLLPVYLAAAGAGQTTGGPVVPPTPWVVAHRGASAYAPENTVPAFQLAAAQGATFVELDLRLTRDGQIVCLHDDSLERTTDVEQVFPTRGTGAGSGTGGPRRWPLEDFTLAELKQLDAGSWFGPEFRGTRIPTFGEAIDALRGRAGLFIELKSPERYEGIEALVLRELRTRGLDRPGADPRTPVLLQSFTASSLQRLAGPLRAGLPIHLLVGARDADSWLTTDGLARLKTFATGISPEKTSLQQHPEAVVRAREMGLLVTPYTFRSGVVTGFPDVRAEMAHYLRTFGVDGVITDNPDQAPHVEEGFTRRRAAFLDLIDRPRVPLAPVSRAGGDADGLLTEEVSFASEAGHRVPTLILKRRDQKGRQPAVIVLHGTGGSKNGMLPRLRDLAGAGFVAVAIDGRYHGERAGAAPPGGLSSYHEAIVRAYRTRREHPFLYDSVWDVMRLIDYLDTRADVDAARIGLTGISKGGMETYLTAAVDLRVAVAVPVIGVQSFQWALDHGAWDSRAWTLRDAIEAAARDSRSTVNASFMRTFYDRVAPGLYGKFDGPAMLPLIAPRPLLVINGDSDPRTPAAGVRECVAAAERVYLSHGAGDRLSAFMQPNAGHEVTPDADRRILSWFRTWLDPARGR